MPRELANLRRRLLQWYDSNARQLPWRKPPGTSGNVLPDPYHVLISEAMLQQTQVATVIPYFHRFLTDLPTFSALASAHEQQVLRLWQGLGYYARARHLQATAKIVVNQYAGNLPTRVEELLQLPGIGRYTAGAIASIAFDRRAPILDGNVARVLCRLDAIAQDPKQADVRDRLWQRAEEILPDKRCGDFNSAMMDLGATVCTPRNPQCDRCPVRDHCAARAAGIQDRIPLAATTKERPLERRWTFCLRRAGRWLIEQRPSKGRWANLWQFVTVPAEGASPPADAVRKHLGLEVGPLTALGTVTHDLSHRRYQFSAYRADVTATARPSEAPRRWVRLADLAHYPMSRPQLRIAAVLRNEST